MTKPKPSFAPVYAAMYPEIAETVREHGYALAIHGSLQRDFDLIAIPWVNQPSTPTAVIEALAKEFDLKLIGSPTTRPHGRLVYTLSCGWGECALDLGFMGATRYRPGEPVELPPVEALPEYVPWQCECGGRSAKVTGVECGKPIEGVCVKCRGLLNLTDE